MQPRHLLAIIGSGPSCLYLLKHLLDDVERFREKLDSIVVFEKRHAAGMGMPYSPETTERVNMSNISSEELPELTISFADWLRGLGPEQLAKFDIEPAEISESEVYSRLALGEYFHAQYQAISARLTEAGLPVQTQTGCKIVDVQAESAGMILTGEDGARLPFDRVVLATGHYWPEEDHPEKGYFTSPWPIAKLAPAEGEMFNFTVGTLGASLSAFDVVSSLAHRHGTFEKREMDWVFHPHPGAEDFRIAMHAGDGLLPHLQYAQAEPMRDIERYASRAQVLALLDEQGFLRLATYFNRICRPVLIEAFQKDGMAKQAAQLQSPEFGLEELAQTMTDEHTYEDAFADMRQELEEADRLLAQHQPFHWKEALDDLAYTLNFYAELMPAEDHLTFHGKFLPFLMNVIAALPLPSARLLLAMRDAGRLELITGMVKVQEAKAGATATAVSIKNGEETADLTYRMFVDCGGQASLEISDFPFPSLRSAGHIRAAQAVFSDPEAAHALPESKKTQLGREIGQISYPIGGIEVDAQYRLVGSGGETRHPIYDLAFPHTSGVRPYSYGLQACNDTARILVEAWLAESTSLDGELRDEAITAHPA